MKTHNMILRVSPIWVLSFALCVGFVRPMALGDLVVNPPDNMLRIVSYNMHGKTDKLPQFKAMLQGEHIICLQEVDDYAAVRKAFSDYPYVYRKQNKTAKTIFFLSSWLGFEKPKRTNILICSKLPFASLHSSLIQTDPGGDKWRRYAQHVKVKLDASTTIDLFHYHNTYNWDKNNSSSEKSGLDKFIKYVSGRIGDSFNNVVLAGDFNLVWQGSGSILPPLQQSNKWVDYVCSSYDILSKGHYDTEAAKLSDHDAVWAKLDIRVDISAAAGRIVKIFNLKQGEYLYAADYKPFNRDRRRVFTWRPGNPVMQGPWRLEPAGNGEYRIFNTHQMEYLYAAGKSFDKDRRRVFTWRPGTPVPQQGTWKLIDRGRSGFQILNTHHMEYLYAADYKPFDKDRRRVFTWRPGNPVSQGYWKIE